MLFINNHQYFTISDMTEGTNASGMLEQLTSGLTISEDIDKAQAFQNAQDHRQAIQYYEKVCIIDYNVWAGSFGFIVYNNPHRSSIFKPFFKLLGYFNLLFNLFYGKNP